ncbi:aldehyde dehydrogenase domain-containing protein [Paraphoma chrysanthemicola]|uniref:Aldehyde dehydrogenase domain-containing protein n=1 Tax=Paraphoma chrysanthemicola TaxID=798071 RepID=A0A8K0RH87_9PLEO|nr:aldehyde dehydrogenase domain-containing protein [Paraphoma chrysanthemicola]
MSPSLDSNGTSMSIPLWIGGTEQEASSTFDVISPGSGKVCWSAASATSQDALKAVEAADKAFASWSKTKPAKRMEVLLKTASILEGNSAEYAGYMATEMGIEVSVAQSFMLPIAVGMMRDIAGRTVSICGSVPQCQQDGQSAIVFKEPYGVTLGIVPWNSPYIFGVRSAATAIATGNTTILKSSELTPRCYWAVGKAFHEAGLPPGVLNVLSCPPSAAEEIVNTIIEHPAVRHINFTGSASVGRKIARVCGQNLKPCLMELGGKNSAIVLEDADLQKAVDGCVEGAFINAGQVCMATDRVLVHTRVVDQFLDLLKASLARAASAGSPLPVVATAASKSRLQKVLSEAVSKGANVVCGSDRQDKVPGASIIPTVLKDVDTSTTVWNEENFGPLVAVTTVRSDEQAVQITNSSEYGLSASIFTRDLRKGFALARQIQSGAVHINSMTVQDEAGLAFGGVKNSGWGRFNSEQGMEEFLVTKVVTWDD